MAGQAAAANSSAAMARMPVVIAASPLALVFLRHRREITFGAQRIDEARVDIVLDLLAAAGELRQDVVGARPRDLDIGRRLRLEVVVGDVEDFRIADLELL